MVPHDIDETPIDLHCARLVGYSRLALTGGAVCCHKELGIWRNASYRADAGPLDLQVVPAGSA